MVFSGFFDYKKSDYRTCTVTTNDPPPSIPTAAPRARTPAACDCPCAAPSLPSPADLRPAYLPHHSATRPVVSSHGGQQPCGGTSNNTHALPRLTPFSAKERDSETGLSYFGARYYSSDLSIWLSVDPMSDKYPSLSPYTYCANNPVRLVDPNGEEYRIPPWLLLKGIARVVEATSKNADVKP